MRNFTSEVDVSIGNRSIGTIILFLVITFILSPNKTEAQALKVSVELEQSANGPVDAPLSSPVWTKKHLNKTNSHYAAGSVIPYRAIVTNIPTNCPLKIRLIFQAVKNCKHAIDFLTNYNEIPEEHIKKFPFENYTTIIDPVAGLTGNLSGPTNFAFPVFPFFMGPVIIGPPADQNTPPQAFNYFSSKYGPQSLSAWNAQLSGIESIGLSQHNNNHCISEFGDVVYCNCVIQQTFEVTFTATSLPVVFAWGGHMAYDTVTFTGNSLGLAYTFDYITESGSSGVGGVTKCLTQAQSAAIGSGNDAEFDGGGEEITYSFSGGKPINPTSSNNSELQREEIAISQKASVFPNPNNGSATVMLPPNAESSDIRLTDISGKIIKSWSDYKNQRLELTGLRSGMYFLNIISRSSQNKTVLKVVVLK
jgi:hypothetical protein